MDKRLKDLWKIPNILSLARLLCVPLFLVLFFCFRPNYIPAFVVFLVASLTDVVDGYLARKLNQTTPIGAALDPLADKMLKISTLFAFAYAGILSWWLFGVLCFIDLSMVLAGLFLFGKRIVIPSNIIGKLGTFAISVGLLMCFFPNQFAPWNEYVLYIGLGIVISSVILYVFLNYKRVFSALRTNLRQKAPKTQEEQEK